MVFFSLKSQNDKRDTLSAGEELLFLLCLSNVGSTHFTIYAWTPISITEFGGSAKKAGVILLILK